MGLLTTNHFCCCFSLRTGGLIVGFFGLASGILGITTSIAVQWPVGARLSSPCLILSMCWLYGIYARKPSWLLLNVILSIVNLLLFAFIFVVYTGLMPFIAYNELYPSAGQPQYEFPIFVSLYFFLVFITVFQWHSTAAAYSLYKDMKSDEMNRSKVDRYFIANLTQKFSTTTCKTIIV